MLVSIKGKFICPIAYFFINGVQANNQATLMKSALERLHSSDIRVWCVTCDGWKIVAAIGVPVWPASAAFTFSMNSTRARKVTGMASLGKPCLQYELRIWKQSEECSMVELAQWTGCLASLRGVSNDPPVFVVGA
ncbi:uncharacterized protein LOC126416164 [Schistocerca serialis cubense]|uniref:uncharacterized protein LOC126416164 n=1 Tax=Schistocerca serialis cubense TaxID=2023355 RepID=UPI00214E9669|nr:uncharacterized protein LOC126416164 [Schistocerca serialis cubense]